MPLRIAMLAPPWIPIPPPGYGGIELVVELLCRGLGERGHAVTLFAAPGSEHVEAEVRPVLERPYPNEISIAIFEADHVACAFDAVEEAARAGEPFDLVHDHSGYAAFAFANRLGTPLVHTLHQPFTDETAAFYGRHGHKAWAIAISRYQAEQAPPGLRVVDVVANPIVVDDFPFVAEKDDFLLWVGRFNDEKGPQRAIAAARVAGLPLVLGGVVQPGHEEFFAREVEPHLDGERVVYAGEVGGERKLELFSKARAFLMPIRWPEPFGLVMTEAMACGTPVIAFPEGAAAEVVLDGETGFLVGDEAAMAAAVERLGEISPERCRESARERYDVAPVAAAHERAYERAIAASVAAS